MKYYSTQNEERNDLFNILYAINMVLIFLHGVILFVLYRNTMRYISQFGQARVDPYTVSTRALLGLSTILLFINLPWMILTYIDTDDLDDWIEKNLTVIVSIQEFSKIFSRACFTLAIGVSATRWIKQIVIVKQRSQKWTLASKLALIVMCVLLIGTCICQQVFFCLL